MKINFLIIFLFFLVGTLSGKNVQHFYNPGDFQLENGDKIIDCKIGYRILGQLNAAKSNAVLYPTWFGGRSEHVAKLIGPDKLLDSTNFCIIIVDAFGNGISSSPSNYEKDKFPNVSITDMVNAQHKLLTEHLGINHLYGAIGGSMGSLQVFEWLVAYPDFIDKAIPYVCTPRPTSQDLLLMQVRKNILENGLKYNIPETEILYTYDLLTAYAAHSPEYRVQKTSYDSFPDFVNSFKHKEIPIFTAKNRLCQLQALMSFNIALKFNNSLAEAALAIKTKVFMIVSKTDHILNPQPAINFAELLNAQILILENNCGHLAIGCEMKRCAEAINEFF